MSFLSCPTEVRDMIYKPLLLASSAITMFEEYFGDDGVTHDHGIAKGQYSTPPPELFALLLVNKTIHIGVWDCFFRSNDFALCHTITILGLCSSSPQNSSSKAPKANGH